MEIDGRNSFLKMKDKAKLYLKKILTYKISGRVRRNLNVKF